jgi:hypothetical protein
LGSVALVWLFGLLALISVQILGGKISLSGLLSDDEGDFSPERAQLLVVTILGAFTFAEQSLSAQRMIEPSPYLLYGLGGSNAIYIVGKFLREFLRR